MKVSAVHTNDGSTTIYNPAIDECYHSKFGAITESQHVFIKNGLELLSQNVISIFEVGFGTGLNALLAAIQAEQKQIRINYTAIEKYPLEKRMVDELNYGSILKGNEEIFAHIHDAIWDTAVKISPHFCLHKINQDLLKLDFKDVIHPDIVFFDAFSPAKQPEMWTVEVFQKILDHLKTNGILLTYASAGVVKNALRQAGFEIKRLPGPPGKHHMILARKK